MFIPFPSFTPEHIHPILVNFTAALVPASLGSDVLGRIFRKQSLHDAACWMVIFATAITPFTAVAGLLWKKSAGAALSPALIQTHQWLGISLAIAFIGLAAWRWRIHSRDKPPGLPYLIFTFIVVLALAWQGSLGGVMAFG